MRRATELAPRLEGVETQRRQPQMAAALDLTPRPFQQPLSEQWREQRFQLRIPPPRTLRGIQAKVLRHRFVVRPLPIIAVRSREERDQIVLCNCAHLQYELHTPTRPYLSSPDGIQQFPSVFTGVRHRPARTALALDHTSLRSERHWRALNFAQECDSTTSQVPDFIASALIRRFMRRSPVRSRGW